MCVRPYIGVDAAYLPLARLPLLVESGSDGLGRGAYSLEMSLVNVDTLRRVIDAYNARDVDAFIADFDADCELHSAFAAVGGAVYRRHDGLREFFRDFEDAWGGEVRIEPETYFDLGERVLLFYVLHGRGRHSGAMVELPNAVLSTWRAGRIVHLKAYAHREDAVADSGVPSEGLQPIPA